MGKVAAEPGPFGIETAAGAEEVEERLTLVGSPIPGAGVEEVEARLTFMGSPTPGAGAKEVEVRLTLVGNGPKPGGGVVEVWKRDTPAACWQVQEREVHPQRLEL